MKTSIKIVTETIVKDISEIITDGAVVPLGWQCKAIINDDNMTYLVWNETVKEAIVVDPMREDWETLSNCTADLKGYLFLGVIDTHTHADHVSCAASLAEYLNTPLIQHVLSPSQRVHLRVSRDLSLPSKT